MTFLHETHVDYVEKSHMRAGFGLRAVRCIRGT